MYLYLLFFVNGSYQNAHSKNVLASITPDVSPYSTIMYRTQIPLYVPVTQSVLDTITFQLVDQDNREINLGVHDQTDSPERWSMRSIIKSEEKL